MALNGIDIASYQSTLNPAAMAGTDFIVIKTTQGTGYTNPTWRKQADQTLQAGKLLGLYHYISGGNATAEAAYFADSAKPYVGKAVLALDWEPGQNRAWGNLAYLEQVAREVIKLTGVKPLIYASASVYGAVAPVAKRLDCGLWIAQYATTNATYGYQAHPWREGAYACAIRQYADNGHITGYPAGLDLDLFYGDRTAWMRYAASNGKTQPAPAPKPTPAPATPDLNRMATDTINGKYGNGDVRRSRLGRWYDKVMSIVNARLRKPVPRHAAPSGATYVVRSGDTLSGIAAKHGTSWQTLARINGISNPNRIYAGQRLRLPGGAPSHHAPARFYVVRSGDTLSGIASRLHTSWQHLAQINGLRNPNRIYPGQKLRY